MLHLKPNETNLHPLKRETRVKLYEKCSKLEQTSRRVEMHLRRNCVIAEEP